MTTDRIEKSRFLRAPRSRVWRALTDSRQFGEWFGAKFSEPFKPGSTARAPITHKGYEHLTMEMMIDRMEPERLFSWRWHPYAVDPKKDYSNEPTTTVTFELEKVPGGTSLKALESGFEQLPEERRAEALVQNEEGWAQQMQSIESYVMRAAA